tara:strand:- start:116 stop:460 length:345 start_codon:yes stop_codon:yes gene_type:complete
MNNFALMFSLFAMGHTFIWFQNNSQLTWDFWNDKLLLAMSCFGLPALFCFWWATKIGYEEIKELWSVRMTAFGASYLMFPILTWVFLRESMFTTKTMICIALSLIIVLIQAYWR